MEAASIATKTIKNIQRTHRRVNRSFKLKNKIVSPQIKQQQQQPEFEDYREKRIGFIGVGTISKSMVKGLCNPIIGDKVAQQVYLSPRGRDNVIELAQEFEQVQVMKSNQEVIDNSDWVVVGLLTSNITTIVKDLKFREDQTIINLAAMSNQKFANSVNNCRNIIRACPLPPIALNIGATIVSPQHKGVENMFNVLGSSVAVKSDHEAYSLQGIACLQGPQFSIMKTCYDWMVQEQKVDPQIATKYIMGTYYSICTDALYKINQGKTFDDLIEEQTPGGLNEKNLKYLNEQGLDKNFRKVLEMTYTKMFPKI